MDLITGVLLAAALTGTLLRAHRTWGLPAAWHPVLVLSAWSLVVLVSGIVGSLQAGVVLVVAGGLLAGAYEVVRHRSGVRAAVREPAYLALAGTAVLLALLLQDRVFTHYDNFSHWALVVKVMLETGSLPTPGTPVVTFTTYPLGASSLAYLFQRTLGGSESAAMLGHDLWVASAALPLVGAAGRRLLPGLALYAVGALALLTGITSPTSLLVDSLVAGLAACLLVLVVAHGRQLLASPWPFAVLAGALLLVKTSGALFVALATIVVLATLVRARPWRSGTVLPVLLALAVPWLLRQLWGVHVALTFPDAGDAKHSVSLDRFGEVLGEKSTDDVRTILTSFTRSVLTDGPTLLALLATVAAGLLVLGGRAVERRTVLTLGVLTVVTVVAWELSLALMYLFSMPLGEALKLAGFSRYQGTIRLVVLLVVLWLVARWTAEARRVSPRPLLALVVALGLTVPTTLAGVRELRDLASREEARDEVAAAVGTARPPIAGDERVCVLQSEPDAGYRAWMVRYLTLSDRVRPSTLADDDAQVPGAESCDVVVLLDGRPSVTDLVREAGFDLPAGTTAPVAVRP